MKTTQHTPGPLAYGFTGTNGDCVITYHDKQRDLISRIATIRVDYIHPEHSTAEQYAYFIVTACNAHEELLEACEAAIVQIDEFIIADNPQHCEENACAVLQQLRAAIAKAQGKE